MMNPKYVLGAFYTSYQDDYKNLFKKMKDVEDNEQTLAFFEKWRSHFYHVSTSVCFPDNPRIVHWYWIAEMLYKRTLSFDRAGYEGSLRKKKANEYGCKRNLTHAHRQFPNEVWVVIMKYIPVKRKMPKFILANKFLYGLYMFNVDQVKSLDPVKHVFHTIGKNTKPTFYEFKGVVGKKKKFVKYGSNGKTRRALLRYDNKFNPYSFIDGNQVFRLDKSLMDTVGKKKCELCKKLEYCKTYRSSFFYCGVRWCSMEVEEYEDVEDGEPVTVTAYENHEHILCDQCYSK